MRPRKEDLKASLGKTQSEGKVRVNVIWNSKVSRN
jgi:uncharacterized protein involved in tellurium resistance